MACTRDHEGSVPREIAKLHDSQRGFWRHKCAGCAYGMGRHDAAKSEERLRERIRVLEARIVELESPKK